MFRFCSKTVPERSRGTLQGRSGERPVAIQVLPENAGYSLVILLYRFLAHTHAYIIRRGIRWVPLFVLCSTERQPTHNRETIPTIFCPKSPHLSSISQTSSISALFLQLIPTVNRQLTITCISANEIVKTAVFAAFCVLCNSLICK